MGHGCPRERGILMSVTLQAPEHLSGTLSAGGSAPGTGASVGLVHSPREQTWGPVDPSSNNCEKDVSPRGRGSLVIITSWRCSSVLVSGARGTCLSL